jgi:hypothetical protein
MRARVTMAFVLSLLLLPMGAHSASAATATFVPGLVLDGTVPAYVSGTTAGTEVKLTIEGASATKTAAKDSAVVELAGMKAGLHEWTLAVTANNITTTTHGFVLVDTRMEDIYAALALERSGSWYMSTFDNLTVALHAMEGRLQASQRQMQENLTGRIAGLPGHVAQNVTASIVENGSGIASANLTLSSPALREGMQRIQAASSQAQAVAQDARSLGLWAVAAALVLTVALLPLNVVLILHARKARREALVFLLVLAARAGITPDSPEFQHALAAFDGKKPAPAPSGDDKPAGPATQNGPA